MDAVAYEQLRRLEREHWWFRGRRHVYLGLLREHLRAHVAPPRAPAALPAALPPPVRALDLGSGFGGFLEGLAELCEEVVAADIDPSTAGAAGRRARTPAVACRAEALPFPTQSFGLVCLFDVLEHTDDDRAVLRECRRVLRPGGTVFASVPAYPALYAHNDRVAHHRRRYTRATLRAAFEEAGLALERNTHTNALLLPLIAPAVLSLKAYEALFERRTPSGRTNLSWPLPRALHALCYRAFAAELPLARRLDLPAGHSIVGIARRVA